MQSVRIQGANMTLGKPRDWNDAEHGKCLTLAVRREFIDGMYEMTSAWQPTPDELKRLAAGASIHLTICGNAHPPVMLQVGAAPDETTPAITK